jgi:hypothetical protein
MQYGTPPLVGVPGNRGGPNGVAQRSCPLVGVPLGTNKSTADVDFTAVTHLLTRMIFRS